MWSFLTLMCNRNLYKVKCSIALAHPHMNSAIQAEGLGNGAQTYKLKSPIAYVDYQFLNGFWGMVIITNLAPLYGD